MLKSSWKDNTNFIKRWYEYDKKLLNNFISGDALSPVVVENHLQSIKYERKRMVENIIVKIKQSLNSVEIIRGDTTNKLQPEIGYSMREVDNLLDELAEQFV